MSIPGSKRNEDVAFEDAYKSFNDKTEEKAKLKIISEDFIDDIVERRKSMAIEETEEEESVVDDLTTVMKNTKVFDPNAYLDASHNKIDP